MSGDRASIRRKVQSGDAGTKPSDAPRCLGGPLLANHRLSSVSVLGHVHKEMFEDLSGKERGFYPDRLALQKSS